MNAPAGLTFPTDLAGATAVISIEPSPDDAAAPFTLKPLVGAIPVDATDHVTYSMGNQAAGFSTGTATISSGQPTGENLFADFDKFVVTIEPVTDPDPGPSADVALIHTIPAGGILHIRHLLFSLPSNPPYAVGFHTGTPKGITVGLREQAWAAWVHADLSVNSTNLADAILHACHVVNIIEGTGAGKGENFDANCGNPGDGFGVLSYAADTVLHAGLSATAAAGDQKLVDHSKEVIDSANQAWAWAKDARDVALTAKTSTDFLATQLLMRNVKSILGKTFNGFDADGDGAIERITGEGGTKQAYWAAQDMGEYLLTSPSDVAPPKTGDSNVPNVALAALLTGAFLLMTGVYVYRRSRRQT